MKRIVLLMLICNASSSLSAADFDIIRFGAAPDDESDDTTAIEDALTACEQAGGGTVFVPTGTFILSRRNSETPILEVPPKYDSPRRRNGIDS